MAHLHRDQASMVSQPASGLDDARPHDSPVIETPDFLLAALDRANEAVMIADGDLRVRQFNAAAERIWQMDRTEVLGCHVSGLGLGGLPQPIAAPASGQMNGDGAAQRHDSEITIQRKDGSRIRAALSRVDVGGQSRTIAFVSDITAEVALREKLTLLNLVADRTNARLSSPIKT
jgi:PAS domain S-box-containing protein